MMILHFQTNWNTMLLKMSSKMIATIQSKTEIARFQNGGLTSSPLTSPYSSIASPSKSRPSMKTAEILIGSQREPPSITIHLRHWTLITVWRNQARGLLLTRASQGSTRLVGQEQGVIRTMLRRSSIRPQRIWRRWDRKGWLAGIFWKGLGIHGLSMTCQWLMASRTSSDGIIITTSHSLLLLNCTTPYHPRYYPTTPRSRKRTVCDCMGGDSESQTISRKESFTLQRVPRRLRLK